MIVHDHKLIFIHINRTGGTTIERAFGKNISHLPAVQHATAKELSIKHPVIWETYFKFTVIRNPWDRIVSIWKNRVDNFASWNYDPNLSFRDWLNQEKNPFYLQPQLEWILDKNNNKSVDFIARFERYEKDLQEVFKQIGTTRKLGHFNKTKKPDYRFFYDDDMIELVAERYKQDIDYFGYTFE